MRNDAVKSGFTLVEVMVAVFIFSIIMLTLFSSFSAFMSSGQLISRTLDEEDRVRSVLKRIDTDLQFMFITRKPRYRAPGIADDPDPYRLLGTRERIHGNTFSRLEFASRARVKTNADRYESIGRVTYYVKENKSGGYDLCRADTPVSSDRTTDPCRDPILAKNIRVFEMRFMDSEGEPEEEWDSDSKHTLHRVPGRIGLKIGFVSGDGTQYVDTLFLIPVNRKET